MDAVDLGPRLWAVDLLFFFVLVGQFILYVGARREKRGEDHRSFLGDSIAELRSGSVTDDVRLAWEGALLETNYTSNPQDLEHSIVILARASGDWVDAVRHACKPRINELNDFCELIDEGILRPLDLVKESPLMHAELLEELSLLEPFVWYQATLGGRGRWAFRPLQLLETLGHLRAVSPNSELRGNLSYGVKGHDIRKWAAISPGRRFVELIRSRFSSRTITVHSKIRQNRQRERILRSLSKTAPDIPIPASIGHRAIEW